MISIQFITIGIILVVLIFLLISIFLANQFVYNILLFKREYKDQIGDIDLIQLYQTKEIPEPKDYHDISETKIDYSSNKLLLTMELNGDPNENKRYETVYIWVINYTDPITNRYKAYTILVPNFPADSTYKVKGWHLAIFDNMKNYYTLPLSAISTMPKDKVEVFFDPVLIGNPISFDYNVSVMIRVNDTFLYKPPDYIVDSSPDNYMFWLSWFS